LILWLLLSLLSDLELPIIEGTGIYAPVDANSFALGDDGTIYLMDARERQILIYAPNGTLIARIGGRGQGPGEFSWLWGIRFANGRLYALDPMAAKATVFTAEGGHLETLNAPRAAMIGFPYLAKTVDGWVFLRNTQSVVLVDDRFENERVLFEGEPPPGPETYIPLRERPGFATGPEGRRIYIFTARQRFEILVYSVSDRVFEEPITRKVPLIPLDKEFAKQRFEEMTAYRARRGRAPSAEYPDYFPVIEHLRTDFDGRLVVWPGLHIMNKATPPIVLDRQGHDAESRFPVHALDRILAVEGDLALVTFYRDEELGLCWVAVPELGAFFRDHPANRWR